MSERLILVPTIVHRQVEFEERYKGGITIASHEVDLTQDQVVTQEDSGVQNA